MNLEAQQRMIEQYQIHNPEGMLKKNRFTGTTDPFTQLHTQKYDEEKNIVLKKNPFILTQNTVANKHEFDKEAHDALMMMYNKKKALMHSILLYKNQVGHVYPESMVQAQ